MFFSVKTNVFLMFFFCAKQLADRIQDDLDVFFFVTECSLHGVP